MSEDNKDLSKTVHQLRELLVSKEEEIEDLRKQLKGKGVVEPKEGPPPDQLTEELEKYRGTVASLEKNMEELKRGKEDKLKELEAKLQKKDKTIASMKDQLKSGLTPTPDAEEDRRLNEALDKIALLEEELSKTKAEAAQKTEELRSGETGGEDSQDQLSSAKKERDQAEGDLLKTKESYRRLSRKNTQLVIAAGALGIALCISLAINIKQRRAASGAGGGMDFITAAEEPLLKIEGESPRDSGRAPSLASGTEAADASISSKTHFEYTVKAGDSLWKICKRELGSASLVDRVARENNLKKPRALKVGMTLYLPKVKSGKR